MAMHLGQIEKSGKPGRRDAFHSPAVLVTAKGKMFGGEAIRFTDDTFTEVVDAFGPDDMHAVVDPFVDIAEPGQMFWAWLKPGSVTNLVHEFDIHFTDMCPSESDAVPEPDACRRCES